MTTPVTTLTLEDASGNKYDFQVHKPNVDWKNVAGLYGFASQLANGNWFIHYIGQTGSLKTRHNENDHERWEDGIKDGATHIMARVETNETTRLAVEKALISHYKPRMNTQHVKKEAAQKSGLSR